MRLFFSLLALGANAAVLVALVLIVGSRFSPTVAEWRATAEASIAGRELMLAFVVAATATLGSLYFSEIADFEPCKYCWFQRIAMYPLAVIFGIAAWRRDHGVRLYGFTLAGLGGALAAYHYLIQQYPELSSSECSVTVPCTAAYVWEFGFISIPWMALSAFALIIVLLAIAHRNERATGAPSPESEVSS